MLIYVVPTQVEQQLFEIFKNAWYLASNYK